MTNLLKRGTTYFVRLTIPQSRWADVGRAMGAAGGVKREVVRTLQTGDFREAQRRREAGLAALREIVDGALRRAGLAPLTDWTANWQERAVELQEAMRTGEAVILGSVGDPDDEDIPVTEADLTSETVEREVEALERKRGADVAAQFARIALMREMSVAEAARQWLASIKGTMRDGTWRGYEASIGRLGTFLTDMEGLSGLEGVGLCEVTRKRAGAAIEARRADRAWETVAKDFAAWNGLWRWAVRRGHTDSNPWADQTAGMKAPRERDRVERERGYTAAELVKLLHAGADELAPNGSAYAVALWDVIRLGLLTGARASELVGLRLADVIEDATLIATRPGKSDAAARLLPLHRFAQDVVRARLASLEDHGPAALLFPEVAGSDRAEKPAKALSTRFVAARRRILGDDDTVDLHSLRRSWSTAAETAIYRGGRVTPDLQDRLFGHKTKRLAADLYSDWSRLGRRMVGDMTRQVAILRGAAEDVIDLGLDAAVLAALEETRNNRPPVVRVALAFRRKAKPCVFG